MKKYQLIQLRDGSYVHVQAEQMHDPPIVYQQDYQQLARPTRRRRARRNEQHPIVTFAVLIVVGFCSIGIHPALCFFLWGFGVIALISAVVERK